MMTATPNDVEHRKTKHKCKQRLVIYLIFDIKTIRADFEFQKKVLQKARIFHKKAIQYACFASDFLRKKKEKENK